MNMFIVARSENSISLNMNSTDSSNEIQILCRISFTGHCTPKISLKRENSETIDSPDTSYVVDDNNCSTTLESLFAVKRRLKHTSVYNESFECLVHFNESNFYIPHDNIST